MTPPAHIWISFSTLNCEQLWLSRIGTFTFLKILDPTLVLENWELNLTKSFVDRPQPVTNPLSPDVKFLPISVSFHGKQTGEANDIYRVSKVLSSRSYNKSWTSFTTGQLCCQKISEKWPACGENLGPKLHPGVDFLDHDFL